MEFGNSLGNYWSNVQQEGVLGIHDLIVHSYGPARTFATVHVEVDAGEDILRSHDAIDNIEREVMIDHGVHLVIHLDPIVTDDPVVNTLRAQVKDLISAIDADLTMHDFRVVLGDTHSNLIFDVVVPHSCKLTDAEITQAVIQGVKAMDKRYFAVVTLDRTYVSSPSHKTKMN